MHKCPVCDYTHEKLISLSIHWRKGHKKTSEELRILLFHDGKRPICACGCGDLVKFLGIDAGYSKYAWGHASRVNNNWGHNSDALLKSQDKRREQIEAGEWTPWNKGETKESSSSVADYGNSYAKTFTSEKRKQYSETLRQNRLNGIVPTLTGSASSQWKGGSSALQPLCRSYLNRAWTYPKLKEANFTCKKCGANSGNGISMNVHHDKERFAEILQKGIKLFGEAGEDFDKKVQIAEWVTDYHLQNDISGIVLCEQCHKLEHDSST